MKIESSKPLNKVDKEIYISICMMIWGCVPVDYDWTTRTNLYKSHESKN